MRSKSITILISIIVSIGVIITAIAGSETIHYNQPFKISYNSISGDIKKQVDCLAENILWEAGYEPRDGKVAVALVTLNRVASGNYAKDICGVVKQKNDGVCQFSWVCQPINTVKRLTLMNSSVYNEIKDIAVNVLYNYDNMHDITKGATYYHADYVNPGWGLPKTTQIGHHIFYKSNKDVNKLESEKLWKM